MKKLYLMIMLVLPLIFSFLFSMELTQHQADPISTVALIKEQMATHSILSHNRTNQIEVITRLIESLNESNTQPFNKNSIMSLLSEGKTTIANFNDTTRQLMTIEDALQKEISLVMKIISNNNPHNKYLDILIYLEELNKDYINKIDSNLKNHETYEHIKKDFETIQSQCEKITNEATETHVKPTLTLLQDFLDDLLHLSLFAFLGWQGRPH